MCRLHCSFGKCYIKSKVKRKNLTCFYNNIDWIVVHVFFANDVKHAKYILADSKGW